MNMQSAGNPPYLVWSYSLVLAVKFSSNRQRLAAAGQGYGAIATPEMLCDKLTTNVGTGQWREWVLKDPDIGFRELCLGLPRSSE